MLSCESNCNHNNNNNDINVDIKNKDGDNFIDIVQPAANHCQIELINHLNQVKHVKCQCKRTGIYYDVHVINETVVPQQICFIMTVHDLGEDSSQFDKLIHHEKMEGLRNRVIWLNVNLPGQELESPDLETKKYPSIEDLGDGLESVLDELKIPQVVCMGQGAGANIAFYFATKHPTRCLGLALLEPVATSAGLVESIRHMLGNRKSLSGESSTENQEPEPRKRTGSILRIEKTGPGTSPDSFHIEVIDPNKHVERRNSKNVAMFADAFYNRACLSDQVHELKVDALIACGKNSHSYANTKKLYKAIQEINRKTPAHLVNSPLLELDNVASVLNESPDRLAVSLQYFLQGIGLLSAMPLRSNMRSSSICSGSPTSPSHISNAAANFARSNSLDDENGQNGNQNHSSGSSSASNSESNSQANLNNNNNNNNSEIITT